MYVINKQSNPTVNLQLNHMVFKTILSAFTDVGETYAHPIKIPKDFPMKENKPYIAAMLRIKNNRQKYRSNRRAMRANDYY